jgi:hypothetical protein
VTTRQRRSVRIRRGRPSQANARRRATTLAGRRAPDDTGTSELRARKMRATTRDNLEISGAGVLLGRDLIDLEQYNVLTTITLWIERLMRGWAGLGGVTGLWYSITGAAVPTAFFRPTNDPASGLADGARRQLERALRRLDGSRDLVVALADNRVPPLVLRVLDGKLNRADKVELERVRLGLDHIAGRRSRQARNSTR